MTRQAMAAQGCRLSRREFRGDVYEQVNRYTYEASGQYDLKCQYH